KSISNDAKAIELRTISFVAKAFRQAGVLSPSPLFFHSATLFQALLSSGSGSLTTLHVRLKSIVDLRLMSYLGQSGSETALGTPLFAKATHAPCIVSASCFGAFPVKPWDCSSSRLSKTNGTSRI